MGMRVGCVGWMIALPPLLSKGMSGTFLNQVVPLSLFLYQLKILGSYPNQKKTKKQNLKLNILGTTDYTLFHGSLGGLPRDYSEDYA